MLKKFVKKFGIFIFVYTFVRSIRHNIKTNAMKTQSITNNEIKVNNLPCSLFVNWYNETTYELAVALNNKVYKSLTNKIEVVHIALNTSHESQQEFAEYLVNEVRLNNILEFKF